MQRIEIDRLARLRDEPHTGHNRWHPHIEPIATVAPGEPVVIETRDAADGQIHRGMSTADLEHIDAKVAHPLTGPIRVEGARPGDLLEIEFVDIEPQPYGWSRFRPGVGFLRERFEAPFLVHWDIADDHATSEQIPGVRIPDGSFMGTCGVAPSPEMLRTWNARESDLVRRGGLALLPDREDAVPATEPIATDGARTMPPRENCGNLDAKQLTRGSRLMIPVQVDGALLSVGDAHFAQGDSECCVTAIEMGATVTVRCALHPRVAVERGIRTPRFAHGGYFAAPRWAVPRNFVATVGYPIAQDGTQEGEDLTLAARNALYAMIDLLGERGYSREQAYVICSVAVDLRISNAVDLPNVTVSALLPEDIFTAS